MEITHFHKHLSKDEERLFNEYVDGKTEAVSNLLTHFADDATILRISIEKFEKHDAYEVEFLLTLPSKSIVAKEASHSITKAVDLSRDRMVSQLKKHIAHLRKDRSHKSIRENQEVSEVVEQEFATQSVVVES